MDRGTREMAVEGVGGFISCGVRGSGPVNNVDGG